MVDAVIAKIEAQQKGKEGTAPWMVGEQLKDICRNEPACAELVDKDLDIKEMSISECEKKIKAFADKNKKGNFSCVPPMEAEKIIREFYGLPQREEKPVTGSAPTSHPAGEIIDISDFLI